MLNKAQVIGYLGADPELRYTQSQQPVAQMNVATTKKWKDKDGKDQEQTEWHRIVVWGKTAENVSKYLSKVRPVFVEGELRTRSWDDKDGVKRYTTEIHAHNVVFLPSGGEKGNRPPAPDDSANPRQGKGSGGGGRQPQQNDYPPPDSAFGGPETPGLDDIPF